MRTEEMRLKVAKLANGLSTFHHFLERLTLKERREFPEMIHHLQAALEELSAADEELQVQNQQLMETREQLDEERQRYRELFDKAPFGYVLTDSQGIILEANLAIHDLCQIPHFYLRHKRLISFLAADAHRQVYLHLCRFCDAAAQEPASQIQTNLLCRDGTTLPVLIQAYPLHRQDAGRTMVGWVIRNICEEKMTHDALRHLHAEVEQRIAGRTEHLQREIRHLSEIIAQLNGSAAAAKPNAPQTLN